jgi:predicted DCC family thiol-disulfide oxidoreductase YuxK
MTGPATRVTTPATPQAAALFRWGGPRWTGGQYSLARVLVGAHVSAWFATVAVTAWRAHPVELLARTGNTGGAGAAAGVALTGMLAALLFAAGAGDRASAVMTIVAGSLLSLSGLAFPGAGGLAVGGVLLSHLMTPPVPYGSWAARGRPDPGIGWSAPRGWWHAVWIAIAAAQLVATTQAFATADALSQARAYAGPGAAAGPGAWLGLDRWVAGTLAVAFVAGAIIPRLRRASFAVAFALEAARWIAALAGIGSAGPLDPRAAGSAAESGTFLAALLFAFDPAWVRGSGDGRGAILFYDGACGLCHRAVRFVVAEDPAGTTFHFAPLESSLLETRLTEPARRALPDSLVVLAPDGRVLTRSVAVRFILVSLGGYWTILGRLGGLVPVRVGDALYDFVARHRRRWFAAPADTCPVMSPVLRERFTLDGGTRGARNDR